MAATTEREAEYAPYARNAEKNDGKRAYYWKAENNWIQPNEVRKDMQQQQQTATTTME